MNRRDLINLLLSIGNDESEVIVSGAYGAEGIIESAFLKGDEIIIESDVMTG